MIGPPPAQRLAGRLGLRAAAVAVMAALAMLPQVMSISALRSEPAHAATSGITLRAGENLTLAGHSFTVTRIGRYDDVRHAGGTVTGFDIVGDTAWRTASSMQSSPRNETSMTNETGMTVDEAQAYNRRLIDSGQYDLGQPDAEQQNGSGDSGTVIGRILIPTISTDLPIRQSSDAETLRLGAGLLHDTSLPVGGLGTAGCTARRSIPIYGLHADDPGNDDSPRDVHTRNRHGTSKAVTESSQ